MRSNQNFFKILSFSSLLVLASCGYAVEKSNQTVEIVTPGAENARCDVWVDKIRYQVNPPQKINIMKSENDMMLDCHAPGNRHIKTAVPPKFENKAIWGTPAGMAWDYASNSLFYYPDVIAVDFSQEPIIENAPPKHNSADIKQPEDYNLEEFSPSQPRLNKDKNAPAVKLKRRGEDEAAAQAAAEEEYRQGVMSSVTDEPEVQGDKGSLMTILERLGASDDDKATPPSSGASTTTPAPASASGTATVPEVDKGEAVSGPTPLFTE